MIRILFRQTEFEICFRRAGFPVVIALKEDAR